MAKIYAYFHGGVADGECHSFEARVADGMAIPPERLAVDRHHIYALNDYVTGVPDSYTYRLEVEPPDSQS